MEIKINPHKAGYTVTVGNAELDGIYTSPLFCERAARAYIAAIAVSKKERAKKSKKDKSYNFV